VGKKKREVGRRKDAKMCGQKNRTKKKNREGAVNQQTCYGVWKRGGSELDMAVTLWEKKRCLERGFGYKGT